MKVKVIKPKYKAKTCMNFFEGKISYALFIRYDRPDSQRLLQIIFPFLRDWKYIDSFETLGELEDFIKTRGFDKKKRKENNLM